MRMNNRIITARAVTTPTISQMSVISVPDQPVVFAHSEVAIWRTIEKAIMPITPTSKSITT